MEHTHTHTHTHFSEVYFAILLKSAMIFI